MNRVRSSRPPTRTWRTAAPRTSPRSAPSSCAACGCARRTASRPVSTARARCGRGSAGVPVTVAEETSYPFSEHLALRVDPETPVEFLLHLRIPSWATGVTATCAGADIRARGRLAPRRQEVAARGRDHLSFGAEAQPVPSEQRRVLRAAGAALLRGADRRDNEAGQGLSPPRLPRLPGVPRGVGPGTLCAAQGPRRRPGLRALRQSQGRRAVPVGRTRPCGLQARMLNQGTGKVGDRRALVPMGSGEAILRRMTFPLAP
jgi:hypothetical protein